MDPVFERVYTIDDWYDGARGGAADYQGHPHVYRSLYLDSEASDAGEDRFELSPIGSDLLAWMIEADALHQRWYALYRAGETPAAGEDEPRVLPGDRPRYEALTQRIQSALAVVQPRFTVRGKFEYGPSRVRWFPLG